MPVDSFCDTNQTARQKQSPTTQDLAMSSNSKQPSPKEAMTRASQTIVARQPVSRVQNLSRVVDILTLPHSGWVPDPILEIVRIHASRVVQARCMSLYAALSMVVMVVLAAMIVVELAVTAMTAMIAVAIASCSRWK
ncbi:hypothetical protein EAF00_009495 [Botryotinia globosa]|nr:hypothetical protein EAF00_009495 [Botryotinia globosa]